MTALGLFRVVSLAICLGLGSAQAVAGAGSPIQQLTDDAAADVRPAWSPDGQYVAFQSNRSGPFQIYVVRPDGSDERLLSTSNGADDRHPSWSPDGKLVAVDSGGESIREIWTIDVATGARAQVTRLGAIASFPSWSPNGAWISFFVYRAGTLDLWSVGADGSSPRQLTRDLASEQKNECTFACHAAGWSPDGGRIAYTTGDQTQVWTMRSSDGGDRVKVSADGLGGRSHFPAYLGDGRLAYVTEHVTTGQAWTDVWAVRPGRADPPEPLLQDVQAQGPFVFSPDGQRMLFFSPRSGNLDIYVVPLTPEGKETLKVKSASAEPAPGLAARAAAAGPSADAARAVAGAGYPAGAAGPASGAQTSLRGVPLYVLAIGAVAALGLAVEGVVWVRRRKTRGAAGGSGRGD